MVQPGGPSNHCLTSSGLVNASKTSRRGALNTRVMAISRSLGVVTLNVPLFIIAALLYRFVRPRVGNCPPKDAGTSPATLQAPEAARAAAHKSAAARQRERQPVRRH